MGRKGSGVALFSLWLQAPSPTTPKFLVLVITSHAPRSTLLGVLPIPEFPPGTAKRPPSPLGSPGIFWPGPRQGGLEQKGLKDMGTACREVGTSVTARGGQRFGRLLLQKVFLSSPRFLGGGHQVPVFTVFTYLSNADKNIWLLGLVGGLSEIMQSSI